MERKYESLKTKNVSPRQIDQLLENHHPLKERLRTAQCHQLKILPKDITMPF